MKRIVYEREDGCVSIIYPVINTFGEIEGFTENDALERAMRSVPKDARHKIVDINELPEQNLFRNAWVFDEENGTRIDMVKAIEIKKDEIRKFRNPLLEKLDIEYQKADEKGDLKLKESISIKKQALRDATQDSCILDAKTPEELASAMPKILRDL